MREGINGVDGVDGVDSIDAVYDVTVAYNQPYHSVHIGETFPPTVVQLLSANETSPKEIHFHITRHPIKNIPIQEIEAAKWLCSRFAIDKENLLEKFDQVGGACEFFFGGGLVLLLYFFYILCSCWK